MSTRSAPSSGCQVGCQPVPSCIDGLHLPIPRSILGTMTFGDTTDICAAEEMVDLCLEAGVTMIDTANVYAGGASERMLSGVIKSRRDRFLLASKAGMPHVDHGHYSPLSARGLRRSVEGSLSRLGVGTIDLFYLHQPDRAAPLAETLDTVAALTAEGKIRTLGISNHAAWQIADLTQAAQRAGAPRPLVAQQLYSLVARRVEDEYLEYATTHGLHTVAFNPLAGGLLTGRHSFENTPKEGRFGQSKLAAGYRRRYWNARTFEAITAYSEIAASAGISLTELSLRWLAHRNGVGSVLLGGSRIEHLQANLIAISKGPLTFDMEEACDAVAASLLHGPMPPYNR